MTDVGKRLNKLMATPEKATAAGRQESMPIEQSEHQAPAPEHSSSRDRFNEGDRKCDASEEDDTAIVEDGTEPVVEADKDPETSEDDYGQPLHRVDTKPYSVFTHGEKRIIIFCAGVCSFLSPISAQIYFPALNAISTDLGVSYDLVNLTITTYLVRNFVLPVVKKGVC